MEDTPTGRVDDLLTIEAIFKNGKKIASGVEYVFSFVLCVLSFCFGHQSWGSGFGHCQTPIRTGCGF